MQEKLREALKKVIASDFRIDIGYFPKDPVIVAIARSRLRGLGSSNKPETWYRELGEKLAQKYKASFLVGIDEDGIFIYDGFAWGIEGLSLIDCDIKDCVAAIKDFMAGIEAGRAVDPDQVINAARLEAALEAAKLSVNKSAKGDRDDFL